MNNNMIMTISTISVSTIGIITAICFFVDTLWKRKKEKKVIEGREYRKTYGLCDFNKYKNSEVAIKILSFLYQTNIGSDPQTFNKNLPFIDYYDSKIQLVINKEQF